MLPQLETVQLAPEQQSFKFFMREAELFEPYWHYHPEMELTYIKQGSGLRFVGDHIGTFAPGDLVLLGPNLPHNWVSKPTAKDDHCAYVAQFHSSFLRSFPEARDLRTFLARANAGTIFPQVPRSIFSAMEKMNQQEPFEQLLGLLHVLDRLRSLPYSSLSTTTFNERSIVNKHQKRVAQVTAYILNRLDQPINLEQVADFSGLTVPSFCRWFKQSVGKKFIDYLHTLRVERACQTLLQTDWSISQIAYETGFESISNFNRTFKKYKGMSPREYRRSMIDQSGSGDSKSSMV